MNIPAFPSTASPVFHSRFYQHTSTLLWSGDTVCRRMNRPPYSGAKHVRVEGYRGTLRDEIDIRSLFYLFNEWTKKWTLTRISCRWPTSQSISDVHIYIQRFRKGVVPWKCFPSTYNEVLPSRKYVRYPEDRHLNARRLRSCKLPSLLIPVWSIW